MEDPFASKKPVPKIKKAENAEEPAVVLKEQMYKVKGLTLNEVRAENLPNTITVGFVSCNFCQKYYFGKSMLTNEYDESEEAVCLHCIYTFTYSPATRSNFDGLYGKTIYEYITECNQFHNQDTCTHTDECFLCDYLNGKPIEGIKDSNKLYPEKANEYDPEKEGFKICI